MSSTLPPPHVLEALRHARRSLPKRPLMTDPKLDQEGPLRPTPDAETEMRHVCYDKAHAVIAKSLDDARDTYGAIQDDESWNVVLGAMEQNIAVALIETRLEGVKPPVHAHKLATPGLGTLDEYAPEPPAPAHPVFEAIQRRFPTHQSDIVIALDELGTE
jgi:hypothetical protein